MRWQHNVSAKWLKERKECLMSTDIVALLPAYKRAKKAKWTQGKIIPEFAALWYEKHSDIEPDTMSYNAAARGHFMEPYAIEEYRKLTGKNMLHWDNMLINLGVVGFSPDGMPVGIYKGVVDTKFGREHMVSANKVRYPSIVFEDVKELVEIKCYEPKHHLKTILADPADRIERFQIATAMYVLPDVESVDLFLYCPSTPKPIYMFNYNRNELRKEIAIVDEIGGMWRDTCHLMINATKHTFKPIYTMKDIEEDYIATQDSSGTFYLK